MKNWVIVCNANTYDINSALTREDTITWPMHEGIESGDTVFFYVSNPYNAILFRCEVIETNIYKMDENSKPFVLNHQFYPGDQKYLRVKKIEEFSPDFLSVEDLKKNGVYGIQTVSELPQDFEQYINRKQQLNRSASESTNNKGHIILICSLLIIVAIVMFGLLCKKVTHVDSPGVSTEYSTEWYDYD